MNVEENIYPRLPQATTTWDTSGHVVYTPGPTTIQIRSGLGFSGGNAAYRGNLKGIFPASIRIPGHDWREYRHKLTRAYHVPAFTTRGLGVSLHRMDQQDNVNVTHKLTSPPNPSRRSRGRVVSSLLSRFLSIGGVIAGQEGVNHRGRVTRSTSNIMGLGYWAQRGTEK